MNNKIKALILTGVLATGALGSSVAYARNIENFSTTVGRLNGSGYTENLTKVNSNQAAICHNSSIGGGYKMDVRVQRYNGTQSGSWVRLSSGARISLPNKIGANLSTRLHFSNDITTPVNVQVSGSWSPDTN